jgi:hypothetical protein
MLTHPRTHSDDAQIVEEILKEAAEPRQAASVKKTLKRRALPLSPRKRLVGTPRKSNRPPATLTR